MSPPRSPHTPHDTGNDAEMTTLAAVTVVSGHRHVAGPAGVGRATSRPQERAIATHTARSLVEYVAQLVLRQVGAAVLLDALAPLLLLRNVPDRRAGSLALLLRADEVRRDNCANAAFSSQREASCTSARDSARECGRRLAVALLAGVRVAPACARDHRLTRAPPPLLLEQ